MSEADVTQSVRYCGALCCCCWHRRTVTPSLYCTRSGTSSPLYGSGPARAGRRAADVTDQTTIELFAGTTLCNTRDEINIGSLSAFTRGRQWWRPTLLEIYFHTVVQYILLAISSISCVLKHTNSLKRALLRRKKPHWPCLFWPTG